MEKRIKNGEENILSETFLYYFYYYYGSNVQRAMSLLAQELQLPYIPSFYSLHCEQ